jgi:hypothetical protein
MKSGKWVALSLPLIFVAAALAGAKPELTPVPSANTKAPGVASPNNLSPELIESPVAQGSVKFENPAATCGTTTVSYYGYDDNGPMMPALGSNVEASKSEPDKNTYLVLDGQHGADPQYDYGKHFLFQGHETGKCGYITRVNLDADPSHRITLMATLDAQGLTLPVFDGSTWYPFSNRLLLTTESLSVSGAYQATLDVPSKVESLGAIMGKGGFEGIQSDADGNLIIVEDVGGTTGPLFPHSKQPNSFVYRFIPKNPTNLLAGGKLQALQVISLRSGQPIAFHSGSPDADAHSNDVLDLHTYGKTFDTKWVTIHDTTVDPPGVFSANDLAKSKSATPFKRPENGQFRPGTGFSEFVFDETGDTDIRTEVGASYGGFGSIMSLKLTGDTTGKLTLVYLGDAAHSGFDNCAFWSKDEIVFVEDAGDTLHMQRNALDSAWLFDLNVNYANSGNEPIRILAEGRDASATIDSGLSGTSGFQNEGDNEITGWHLSDGNPAVQGLLGAREPKPFKEGWRLFYTQQHGDNFTWEILPKDK